MNGLNTRPSPFEASSPDPYRIGQRRQDTTTIADGAVAGAVLAHDQFAEFALDQNEDHGMVPVPVPQPRKMRSIKKTRAFGFKLLKCRGGPFLNLLGAGQVRPLQSS